MKSIKEREWFFSQEKIPFTPTVPDEHYNIYRLKTTGQTIGDVVLDLGIGDEVTLGVTADLHLNFCNAEDREDEELAYTEKCRMWQKNQQALPGAIKALEAADFTDASINLGDTMDYLARGTMELVKHHLVDKYPDIMMAVGGHELTKQMQTGLPDKLPLEERIAMVRTLWPHDIHYYSRVIKEKVMCVILDNSRSRFLPEQKEKLTSDIETCRREGLAMLIFAHEPIFNNDPENTVILANIWNSGAYQKMNMLERATVVGREDCDEVTIDIYRTIIENADVVRAFVAGHWHSQFYIEIKGSYKDENGQSVPAVIPQFVISGNPYFKDGGYMARITVR